MQHPEVIFIRHGATKYTNVLPDLTPEGIEQVKTTARKIEPRLNKTGKIEVVSSPAPRAIGSALTFMAEAGLQGYTIEINEDLRPLQIKDFRRYIQYDEANATPIYGELWISDTSLQDENDLVESRKSVEARAHRAFHQILRRTSEISTQAGEPVQTLVFSHFEIMLPILHAHHTEHEVFPIRTTLPPQHAEAIAVTIPDRMLRRLTIEARNATVDVVHDITENKFRRI